MINNKYLYKLNTEPLVDYNFIFLVAELFFPGVNDYFLNYYLVCLIFCITIYLIFILKIVIWFTIWLNTSSLLEFFFSPLVISILHFSVMLQWDGLFPRLTSQLWLRRLHSQLRISLPPSLLYPLCLEFGLCSYQLNTSFCWRTN